MKIPWEHSIAVAKRENNSRRSFVIVNGRQGKHVPTSPSMALDMMAQLAIRLRDQYTEPCLVVGFAETATAIGLAVAQGLSCASMSTTREPIPDVRYLYFSEAHSHATEQKLIETDVEAVLDQVQRILFVEDEVTTGRTILQIVRLLRQQYGSDRFAFTAASLLNGMDEAAMETFAQEQVDCVFLHKTRPADYEAKLSQYQTLGQQYVVSATTPLPPERCLVYEGALELRRLQQPEQIAQQCDGLFAFVQQQIGLQPGDRVLVLGTEEFMYPMLAVGQQLEQAGYTVRCHATTRSPIVPMDQPGYPLQRRWQLPSVYDAERVTYVYNLQAYDAVLILSDARLTDNTGLAALTTALRQVGNQTIYAVEWRRHEK